MPQKGRGSKICGELRRDVVAKLFFIIVMLCCTRGAISVLAGAACLGLLVGLGPVLVVILIIAYFWPERAARCARPQRSAVSAIEPRGSIATA
jgi:hypothetical protein